MFIRFFFFSDTFTCLLQQLIVNSRVLFFLKCLKMSPLKGILVAISEKHICLQDLHILICLN